MKLIISLLLLLGSVTAIAQRTAIGFGDIYFESYEYMEAIASYKKALKELKEPARKQYIYGQLALCYTYLFQYTKAEEYYDLLLSSGEDVTPSLFIEYGKVLKVNGNYAEAKRQFTYYNELTLTNEADPMIRSVNWAMANVNSVNNYRVFLSNLDVSGQALGYCFYGKGLIYCHGRNKPRQGKGRRSVFDIDYAISENNLEFVGRNNFFPNLPFDENEISPSLSKDETELYFAANAATVRKGVVQKGGLQSDKDGISNYKIYMARKKDAVFQGPEELSFNNRQSNYMHPCILENGRTLVFCSDRPGGFGGFDLYKSTLLRDSTWSEPVNLGPRVNTKENELFPWVTSNLLFFSSKGFNGYGGYDIYIAELNDDIMPLNLKNMGKPINSFRDDVAFMSRDSGATGYFSSNRGREDGADEVYFFRESQAGKMAISILDGIMDTSVIGVQIAMNVPVITPVPMLAGPAKPDQKEIKDPVVEATVPAASMTVPVPTPASVPAQQSIEVPVSAPPVATTIPVSPPAETIIPASVPKPPDTKTASVPVIPVPVSVSPTAPAPFPAPKPSSVVPTPAPAASVVVTAPPVPSSTPLPKPVKSMTPVPSTTVQTPVVTYAPPREKESAPVKTVVAEHASINVSAPVQTVFPHILFRFNDVHISRLQKRSADSAVTILKQYPALKLDINAYTDSRGRSAYNQLLSDKRAAAVRNYMIQKGISARRISAKGWGETKLLNECADGVVCSEEKHAANRRVEIRVYE